MEFSGEGEGQRELEIHVRNTFLHFSQVGEKKEGLKRSKSWSGSDPSDGDSDLQDSESSGVAGDVMERWANMARLAQPDDEGVNHFILNSPNGDSDSFTNDHSEYSSVKGRNSSSTDPPSDEKLRGGSPRSPKKGSPSRVSAGTARNKAPPMALRQHQPTHPEARTGKVFASLGSVFHDEGRCQPCRFVSLPDGCRNGAECTFCHNESHETDPNSAHRPPKGVRSGYKKSVNQVMESDLPDEQKREALKRLATKSPYLRALVRKALPDLVCDSDREEPEQDKGRPTSSMSQGGGPRLPGLQPTRTKLSL